MPSSPLVFHRARGPAPAGETRRIKPPDRQSLPNRRAISLGENHENLPSLPASRTAVPRRRGALGTALDSADNLRTVIDGLRPLGVPVLAATGFRIQRAELGELPDNVIAAPWVPQSEVLARASLVVQHGGSGTTLAALSAGLPQLITPQGADGQATGRACTPPAPASSSSTSPPTP